MDKITFINKVLPKKIASHLIFLGPKRYFIYFIFQRVFRINSQVPWPVHYSSAITHHKNIKTQSFLPILGHHPGCYIQGFNGIEVGINLRYGPNVHIISGSHDLNNYEEHSTGEPIKIGDNCWIGAGAIILPEVNLGNHVIVAAGSVVTKSFKEDDILIGGVPAKIIKKLSPYEGKYNGIER